MGRPISQLIRPCLRQRSVLKSYRWRYECCQRNSTAASSLDAAPNGEDRADGKLFVHARLLSRSDLEAAQAVGEESGAVLRALLEQRLRGDQHVLQAGDVVLESGQHEQVRGCSRVLLELDGGGPRGWEKRPGIVHVEVNAEEVLLPLTLHIGLLLHQGIQPVHVGQARRRRHEGVALPAPVRELGLENVREQGCVLLAQHLSRFIEAIKEGLASDGKVLGALRRLECAGPCAHLRDGGEIELVQVEVHTARHAGAQAGGGDLGGGHRDARGGHQGRGGPGRSHGAERRREARLRRAHAEARGGHEGGGGPRGGHGAQRRSQPGACGEGRRQAAGRGHARTQRRREAGRRSAHAEAGGGHERGSRARGGHGAERGGQTGPGAEGCGEAAGCRQRGARAEGRGEARELPSRAHGEAGL
mmetsp:Transcript_141762/g.453262  ORF Transcript_141762/g.453262 Transcript_141762/m.453262 type:complete len:417 (+) Transcript_141762:264-1514(+)